MGKKTTKRTKKFQAKGGVKAMLKKGTITKRGKVVHKKRPADSKGINKETSNGKRDKNNKADSEVPNNAGVSTPEKQRQQEGVGDVMDFTSEKNLGDLDLESFFRAAAADVEEDQDHKCNNGDSDENEDDKENAYADSDSSSSRIEDVDSDEDDIEDAERKMKQEMANLQSQDPEFHKFLSENESSLLEFGMDEDKNDEFVCKDAKKEEGKREAPSGCDAESDRDGDVNQIQEIKPKKRRKGEEESDVEDEKKLKSSKKEKAKREDLGSDVVAPPADESEQGSPDGRICLTLDRLQSYERSAFKAYGIKGLRRLVHAYKTACHMADTQKQDGDNDDTKTSAGESGSGGRLYHIDSAKVFDRLMVTSLRRCHEAFYYHFTGKGSGVDASVVATTPGEKGWDENKPIHSKAIMKSHRWNDVRTVFQTFFRSTLHLLAEGKEANLLAFVLKNLAAYVPLLTPFPGMAKRLLKTLSSLWSATVDDARESYQSVRLHAFMRIRQLALTQPFPFVEDCLKYTYLAYAKVAKFNSVEMQATFTFLGNCIVELYSLDLDSSYQHAFVYIRQLALHLRSALQKKTKEAFQAVYCWQYFHCLKVWVAVLSANCSEDNALRSLIYPLSEIIFGSARLLPIARYLPLRFHCVRFLQQLAASSCMFIPTTSILFDALDLREFYMKPKKSTKKSSGGGTPGVRLPLILRLPKDDALRTMEQLDACVSELFLLMNREVELYRYSAGFPEFTVRICQRVRKFSKEAKVGRWRAYSKGCVEICDRYSEYATSQRSLLKEAPKDVKRLEILKPLDAADMRSRHESSIAKEKKFESMLQPHPKANANKTDGGKDREHSKKLNINAKLSRTKKIKKNDNTKEVSLDESALEEPDAIREGVDWSEDESEVGD